MSGIELMLHEGLVRVTRLRERAFKDIVTEHASRAEAIELDPVLRGKLEGLSEARDVAMGVLNEAKKVVPR